MFCQICNRQLEPVEPIYRLQLDAAINHGWHASLCKGRLDQFASTRLRQIPLFREQDCEHCGRPVFTPSRWRPKRAIVQRNAAVHSRLEAPNNFEPGEDSNGNAGIAARNSHRNRPTLLLAGLTNRLPTVGEWAYRQTSVLHFCLRACQKIRKQKIKR
jgi:hypothetical protein